MAARCERTSKILAQHRVEVDLAKNLPMVEIDPVLFEQALFNLLDNAAKYAPTGTTVRIQSWRDRDSVGLMVLDEGDGIPPGDLEHIFDKFYRARKVDRVRAGTGLGLAISRGFVEAMRRDDCRRKPRRSNRRRIHDQAPNPRRNAKVGHRRMTAPAPKVLVIDDEPPIRKLLKMGLTTQGYQIFEASTGKAALALLTQDPNCGHSRPRPP